MKTGFIYMHIFPNGKTYIGKTIQPLDRRFGKDFAGYRTQQLLWKAIQKYGVENIRTEILYRDIPDTELNRLETLCIARWNAHKSGNGYNATWGGDGFDSTSASELVKKRLENGTHNWQKKGFYQQQSLRMSEEMSKRWQDPEFRKQNSEKMKKRWQDPEHRKKISDIQRQRYEDPAEREKTSEANRKRWQDPEHRKKMSEANRKRYEDPAEREKTGEASRKSWENPEHRKKYHDTVERNFRIRMGMTKEQFIDVIDYFVNTRGWSFRKTAKIFHVSRETIRRFAMRIETPQPEQLRFF